MPPLCACLPCVHASHLPCVHASQVLRVELPLIAAMSAVSLSVSSHEVEVEAEGVYSPLRLTLPERVDDAAGSAKFDKKARVLTIRLPVAANNDHSGQLV